MESKLLSRRMKFIIGVLKENELNGNTASMTIEEISDKGTALLDEKGICNNYTYRQVESSVYALYRRGLVSLENIPDMMNPTVYDKDTIVTLK